MKVGMVGSPDYQNRKKITDLIFELKRRYGTELEIIGSGGKYGTGLLVKKACMELEVPYVEFPPLHEPWNSNCPEPPYMYNKPYSPKYYPMRNTQIVEYSDIIIGFIVNDKINRSVSDVKLIANKKNKGFMVLN